MKKHVLLLTTLIQTYEYIWRNNTITGVDTVKKTLLTVWQNFEARKISTAQRGVRLHLKAIVTLAGKNENGL